MSKIITDAQHYSDIADAIRAKNGSEDSYKPSEMAEAIGGLQVSTALNHINSYGVAYVTGEYDSSQDTFYYTLESPSGKSTTLFWMDSGRVMERATAPVLLDEAGTWTVRDSETSYRYKAEAGKFLAIVLSAFLNVYTTT